MAIDGTYTFIVESDRGTMRDEVTLVTTGETISGTFNSNRHGVVPLLNIRVNGNEVEWGINLTLGGGRHAGGPAGGSPGVEPPPADDIKTEVKFKGIISENKLSGKLTPGDNVSWEARGELIS